MMLHGIITRCPVATLIAAASTGLACGPALGQGERAPDNPLAELLDTGPLGRMPTPGEAMAAYQRVAGWMSAWELPSAGEAPLRPSAARVALYRSGALVGEASVAGEDASGGAVRAAAGKAMEAAERAILPRRDALWREQMRSAATGLTLSLELAGPLTPLGEAELADPDSALRPGLDGLAARLGERWEVVFPSELAALGVSPSVEFAARAARLLGDPAAGVLLPRDLALGRGVAFYRFEVMHVAGVGEGGVPEFLTRGGRVVEPGTVTVASLLELCEAMLDHLGAARHPEDSGLGLMGTLHPFQAKADPVVAQPTQQALVAVALLGLAQTPQASEAVRQRAVSLARSIMLDLQDVRASEVATEDDGVAGALAWVALHRLGVSAGAEDALRPLFDTCEGMMAAHAGAERGDPQGTVSEAILAWAMAQRAVATGEGREAAERDVRALYRAADPGQLVGLMPWLGWAELALAPKGPVPAGAALRQIRDRVWEHQLAGADTGPQEQDLAGGIVFTRGFVSLPTWSSSRPIAFCATMLGDPRLTTAEELPGEVVRLLSAMRFLTQLSAGEVACRFYPDAALARGGIRAAPWDHRMPPEATAMAMLAASEFLRSLAGAEEAKTPRER